MKPEKLVRPLGRPTLVTKEKEDAIYNSTLAVEAKGGPIGLTHGSIRQHEGGEAAVFMFTTHRELSDGGIEAARKKCRVN